MKLKVELVWEDAAGCASSSIYLISDGRILLEGAPVGDEEREKLSLRKDAGLIAVDRRFIEAVKGLL
jgi:hypothetical protein